LGPSYSMQNELGGMRVNTPEKKVRGPIDPQKNPLRDQAHETHSDVLGSYTGTPYDIGEEPVQDVDDL